MDEFCELKTIGLTPCFFSSVEPLFRVNGGVPISEALAQASDLLFLAGVFAEDAAYARKTDRHAWAAHYLAGMSKAVIDDVVKVLTRPKPQKKPAPVE